MSQIAKDSTVNGSNVTKNEKKYYFTNNLFGHSDCRTNPKHWQTAPHIKTFCCVHVLEIESQYKSSFFLYSSFQTPIFGEGSLVE